MIINPPEIELEASIPGADIASRMKRASVLFGTREGELAGDRGFGLSWDAVDGPIEAVKAALANEIVTKVAKYLPGASVSKVTWQQDAISGQVTPKVVINFV